MSNGRRRGSTRPRTGGSDPGLGCARADPRLKRASRVAVAKLRLDGTPTPRSWVARMTKRSAPTGAGKSASTAEALKRELHAQVLLPPLHRRSRVRVVGCRATTSTSAVTSWPSSSPRSPFPCEPRSATGCPPRLGRVSSAELWNHRPDDVAVALRGNNGVAEWAPEWRGATRAESLARRRTHRVHARLSRRADRMRH